MNAYNLILTMINAGGYKLAEIQTKIKRMFLIGDITEEQFEDLMQRSIDGATPEGERPELLQLIEALADRIGSLEYHLRALEEYIYDGSADDDSLPESTVEAIEWKPWDGISNDYQPGSIVWHNGKQWRSDYPGQNVWEPGTVGTQGMWVELVEEQ